MTLVFKKGFEASLGNPGPKVVQYEVSNTVQGYGATINAKDIGLSSILWLNAASSWGTVTVDFVVALGTFKDGIGDANYATLRAVETGASTGTTAGTFQILAMGL